MGWLFEIVVIVAVADLYNYDYKLVTVVVKRYVEGNKVFGGNCYCCELGIKRSMVLSFFKHSMFLSVLQAHWIAYWSNDVMG